MGKSSRVLTVFVIAGLDLGVGPALSQEPASPAAETVAIAKASPRDLRTIIRDGTSTAERQLAFDTLAARAERGNATAALYLGDLYRTGTFVAADLAHAADAYRLAIEKGNAAAARTLADMHLRGDAPGVSPAEALGYYEFAAAKGDARALQRLGDLYRDGDTLVAAADPDKAATYYQGAIDAGLATASLRLGDLYRDGLDPSASFAVYEAAAARGDAAAMVRLGDAYRDGVAGRHDPLRAANYYQAALDAGAENAFNRLVTLYFAAEDTTDEAVALLETGIAQSRPNAAVTLANAYLTGRGVKTDVPRAVAILEAAMAQGDVPAARRLIRLYVDGKGDALPRDPARAREILAQVSGRLDEDDLFRDTLSLDSATAHDTADFASILDRFGALDGEAQSSLAGQMGLVNPNAYVLMLQAHLRQEGLYSGGMSGMLTQDTISAFNLFCAEQQASQACLGGPLSSASRRVFRDALETGG